MHFMISKCTNLSPENCYPYPYFQYSGLSVPWHLITLKTCINRLFYICIIQPEHTHTEGSISYATELLRASAQHSIRSEERIVGSFIPVYCSTMHSKIPYSSFRRENKMNKTHSSLGSHCPILIIEQAPETTLTSSDFPNKLGPFVVVVVVVALFPPGIYWFDNVNTVFRTILHMTPIRYKQGFIVKFILIKNDARHHLPPLPPECMCVLDGFIWRLV